MLTTTTQSIGLKMPTVTNSGEEKNEQSRLSSFIGAIAVADLVKSTLGPKGMDKILQPRSDEGGNNKIQIKKFILKLLLVVTVKQEIVLKKF